MYLQLLVDCGENFVNYKDGLIVYDNGKDPGDAARKQDLELEECAKICRKDQFCTSFAYAESRLSRQRGWPWGNK